MRKWYKLQSENEMTNY
uniref:Uncharacterized protein n=1 Tax=Lepeophtheirus salmonis TaxID=72036 RepID=A0A0K2TLY5_LEPSM